MGNGDIKLKINLDTSEIELFNEKFKSEILAAKAYLNKNFLNMSEFDKAYDRMAIKLGKLSLDLIDDEQLNKEFNKIFQLEQFIDQIGELQTKIYNKEGKSQVYYELDILKTNAQDFLKILTINIAKERDGSIVALKNKKLVADIDWAIVFNDFGLMMEAEVKDTLAKLRAYTQTEEFKSQKLEDQQIVWDAINKFEVELGGSIKSLTEVQDAYKSYKIALDNLRTAEDRRAEIQSGLDAAKKRLAEAEADGDWLSADVYRTEVEDFTRQLSDADIAVDGFKTTANNAKNEWQTATQKATATLENLSNGFQQLKSGSLAGVAEGLGSLGKAFGNNKIA